MPTPPEIPPPAAPSPHGPLALVCAVAQEAGPLRAWMEDARPLVVGGRKAVAGTLDGRDVLLLPGGMGKTNAAQAATALLERVPVRGVASFGIAGAYEGAGLEVGGIALASSLVYGDEGVDAPAGWLSTEGIGIPLVERGGVRLFNRIPADAEVLRRASAALAAHGVDVRTGTFVTVSCCSGTAAGGREMAARWGGLCEEMESAAVAHVCALYGVPFLALRAASNAVEDRDLSRWRIREASEAAARAVRIVAAAWDPR